MGLWGAFNYNTGDDLLFCSRQCGEDYICLHDGEEDDLNEVNMADEDDRIFIEESTPSPCDQCQKRIVEAPDERT